MKRALLSILAAGALGVGPCAGLGLMSGCAYTHTQEGTSHFRLTVAGTDAENAALSADMKFDGYKFEFRGDPLAFGLRVVKDLKTFFGSIFTRGTRTSAAPAGSENMLAMVRP